MMRKLATLAFALLLSQNAFAARGLGSAVIAAGGSADYTNATSAFPNETGDAGYRNNVAALTADMRVRQPSGTYTRTVVALSGGGGTGSFCSTLSNVETNVCTPLLGAGVRLIEIEWRDPSPLSNTGGPFSGTQGPLALMVRAATAIRAVYDSSTLHDKTKPFIVIGQSGGSSQLSYVLAHYNGGSYIDMAIISCGPPHGRLDFGMMGAKKPAWAAIVATYRTNAGDTGGVAPATLFYDYSYGATVAGGTFSGFVSQSMDGGPLNIAYADSVYNGVAVLVYSQTDVRLLYGDGDSSGVASVGRYYTSAISAKSKTETITTGNVVHVDVPGSTSGSTYIVNSVAAATLNH